MAKLTRADVANRLAAGGITNKFSVRSCTVLGEEIQEVKIFDVTKEQCAALNKCWDDNFRPLWAKGTKLIKRQVAPEGAGYAYC